MMTVISEGGFLGNRIVFSGAMWYNLGKSKHSTYSCKSECVDCF